jgi:hypothetical protein
MKKVVKFDQKYYKVRVRCINCLKWVIIDIPMGTKLLLYLKSNTCENCGCTFCKNITEWKSIYRTTIAEAGF